MDNQLKIGDLVTGIDRSYLRSIYKITEFADNHIKAELVSYNGMIASDYPDYGNSFILALGEYRLATSQEIKLSKFQAPKNTCGHGMIDHTCYWCAVVRVNGTQLIDASSGPITITLPEIDLEPGYSMPMHFKLTSGPKSDCECGTKNPIGQGHSDWCRCFKKEF